MMAAMQKDMLKPPAQMNDMMNQFKAMQVKAENDVTGTIMQTQIEANE